MITKIKLENRVKDLFHKDQAFVIMLNVQWSLAKTFFWNSKMKIKQNFLVLFCFILVSCAMTGVNAIEPKKIIQILGGEIELVVSGKGTPNIILMSGYRDNIEASWGKVFYDIKNISTVLAYNRFNYGNSSTTKTPQTALHVVNSLKNILKNQKINPPYILVGHSLGGVYANLYARKFPKEVVGVVLIESSHPEQHKTLWPKFTLFQKSLMLLESRINPNMFTEVSSFHKTAKQISNAPKFPDIPLIVLTAGEPYYPKAELMEIHYKNQRSLVSMSTQGRQIIVKNSRHYIQNERPYIVIEAIKNIVAEVKAGDAK